MDVCKADISGHARQAQPKVDATLKELRAKTTERKVFLPALLVSRKNTSEDICVCGSQGGRLDERGKVKQEADGFQALGILDFKIQKMKM